MRLGAPSLPAVPAAVLYTCASLVAGATLPDQTWVSGIYDDADDDTVLLLVWDASVIPGASPYDSGLARLFKTPVAAPPESNRDARVGTASRAPPAATITV